MLIFLEVFVIMCGIINGISSAYIFDNVTFREFSVQIDRGSAGTFLS